MSPQPSVEDRLARLEALLEQLYVKAQAHPLGRKVIAYLGVRWPPG